MNITDVNNRIKAHKRGKRIGRGAGSGSGKTAGRGHKGYYSRSGAGGLKGFIGGQTPLRQRLPKRGFNNANFKTVYIPINLEWIEENFAAGDEVNIQTICAHGFKIGRGGLIKVLGTGDLSKALTVTADAFSKSAVEKIEKAGGKAVTAKKEMSEASE